MEASFGPPGNIEPINVPWLPGDDPTKGGVQEHGFVNEIPLTDHHGAKNDPSPIMSNQVCLLKAELLDQHPDLHGDSAHSVVSVPVTRSGFGGLTVSLQVGHQNAKPGFRERGPIVPKAQRGFGEAMKQQDRRPFTQATQVITDSPRLYESGFDLACGFHSKSIGCDVNRRWFSPTHLPTVSSCFCPFAQL